ncbi:MAG TPA: DUF1189 family protein [Acholeplasmataceae bacterium]|nr:DUF1189 family protein [Acholeplasmataceae bacterium]
MFKRLTTSLTKPPLAVFFMKDKWPRVILYLLLIPMILMIPAWMKSLISPGMTLDRYERMVSAISQDLVLEDTAIVDGTLITTQTSIATFDYFNLVVGDFTADQNKIYIAFLPQDMALYVANMEINRASYTSLGLEQHDFSDGSVANVRLLASAIKDFHDELGLFTTAEIFVAYFTGLFDYAFYAILMTLFMSIFTRQLPIPFGMRLKLSIYLTTLYVIVELLAILFGSFWIEYLIIPLLYVWHFWAYRSIKIVDPGVIS